MTLFTIKLRVERNWQLNTTVIVVREQGFISSVWSDIHIICCGLLSVLG